MCLGRTNNFQISAPPACVATVRCKTCNSAAGFLHSSSEAAARNTIVRVVRGLRDDRGRGSNFMRQVELWLLFGLCGVAARNGAGSATAAKIRVAPAGVEGRVAATVVLPADCVAKVLLPKNPLMPRPYLADVGDRDSRDLHQTTFAATHRLAQTGLFSDAALLDMLARHPADALATHRLSAHAANSPFDIADPDQSHDPEFLLDGVQAGWWAVELRDVRTHQPAVRELVEQLYDDLERQAPGFRATRRTARIQISPALCEVPLRRNAAETMLWNLRGRQRVAVASGVASLPPIPDLEELLAAEGAQHVHDVPNFEDRAAAHDLEPGQWITWPQHAPHRVEPLGRLNVSLLTTHYSPDAYRRVLCHRANRTLRTAFGLPCRSVQTAGWLYHLKRTAAGLGSLVLNEGVRPVHEVPLTQPVRQTLVSAVAPPNLAPQGELLAV